ncbi:hypothetical protein M5K25_011838 [Dendrobium thyrsiflorum]|uniref:Uncharacterized protein n=1 Tax=Dendrobium thyrsiflorum TaxID=117978 RepID=A0ABD0VBD7_DENTH
MIYDQGDQYEPSDGALQTYLGSSPYLQVNPSPNESKSRTRSTVGRFKPQFELPNGTGSISTVHSNHSENTLDLFLIYESCHSQKSINRAIILLEKGPKARGEVKKKKRRREEGNEGRNSSSTTAGFSSDAGILSE